MELTKVPETSGNTVKIHARIHVTIAKYTGNVDRLKRNAAQDLQKLGIMGFL
jgi:hypothetical protein